MSARACGRRKMERMLVIYLFSMITCSSAWALQKTVKSKLHNYPNAPIEIKRSQVTLVETFATPTQAVPDAASRKSHIRYANRDGLSTSTFLLNGTVLCANRSAQSVSAFALTIVALDAFHQPIHLSGQKDVYAVQQVVASLPRGGSKEINWQLTAGTSDVYEVAVVVTKVRLGDDSLWVAPGEELIDIF